MIYIESTFGINNVAFGSSETDVIASFGPPIKQKINRENETEFFYPDVILRFEGQTGQFRECTLLPKCQAVINQIPVHWGKEFLVWLASQDNELGAVLGFIVSTKLCIATSGFHDSDESQKAIHIFRNGDWDIFRKRMVPFKIEQLR